jgi:hypothetical protein
MLLIDVLIVKPLRALAEGVTCSGSVRSLMTPVSLNTR